MLLFYVEQIGNREVPIPVLGIRWACRMHLFICSFVFIYSSIHPPPAPILENRVGGCSG